VLFEDAELLKLRAGDLAVKEVVFLTEVLHLFALLLIIGRLSSSVKGSATAHVRCSRHTTSILDVLAEVATTSHGRLLSISRRSCDDLLFLHRDLELLVHWFVDENLFTEFNFARLQVSNNSARVNHSLILTKSVVPTKHSFKDFCLLIWPAPATNMASTHLSPRILEDLQYHVLRVVQLLFAPFLRDQVYDTANFVIILHYKGVVGLRDQHSVADNLNLPLICSSV